MGANSDVAHSLVPGTGAGGDGRARYNAGQNSFEQLSRHQDDSELQLPSPWDNRPGGLGGRSISGEERMAANALLDCVKQRPLSRASDAPSADGGGGGRVDSGVWPMLNLLTTGGEADFQQACGRKEAPGAAGGVDLPLPCASAGSLAGGRDDRKTEQQKKIEKDLEDSMPLLPPFSRFRPGSGSGSRSSSRSASKKAILLADRESLGSEKMWNTGDSTSLSRFFASSFKSSSSSSSSNGSGGSGGGGPGGIPGKTPHSDSGGSSIKSVRGGGGGGGASWEAGLGPPATAGGASRRHDDISPVNRTRGADPGHPLRQPSFVADREIGDISLQRDACIHRVPAYNRPQPASAGYLYTAPTGVAAAEICYGANNGGSLGETPAGVRSWGIPGAFTPARPTTTLGGAASSGVYNPDGIRSCTGNASRASQGPRRMHPGGQIAPGLHHSDHSSRLVNTAPSGPIAPPPIPRSEVPAAPALGAPPPAHHHERKPSYNLLAMMIPDISKFGGGPSSAPALQTATTWPGATGFAANGGSPMVTIDGNPVQAGGGWTRQAALARYHYKRKRRRFVKAMRENDPNRKEQNKARERPRDSGKFKKKHQDFISIINVQRAAGSRSVSGESAPPARDSTTPPPSAQKRRCVAGDVDDGSGEGGSDGGDGSGGGSGSDGGRSGRPLRARRSQGKAADDGSSGGSTKEGSTPTPSVAAAKLGSKRERPV